MDSFFPIASQMANRTYNYHLDKFLANDYFSVHLLKKLKAEADKGFWFYQLPLRDRPVGMVNDDFEDSLLSCELYNNFKTVKCVLERAGYDVVTFKRDHLGNVHIIWIKISWDGGNND